MLRTGMSPPIRLLWLPGDTLLCPLSAYNSSHFAFPALFLEIYQLCFLIFCCFSQKCRHISEPNCLFWLSDRSLFKACWFFVFFLMDIISSQISASMLIGVFSEDVSLNLLCFLWRLFFRGVGLHLSLSCGRLSSPAGGLRVDHRHRRGGRSEFSVAGRRLAFLLSSPGE